MWDLQEYAGAVAHARIGADRAAMLEVEQNGEAVVDDLVRLASLEIGDEADAAGILLERGIVKAAARDGVPGSAVSRKDKCSSARDCFADLRAIFFLPVRLACIPVLSRRRNLPPAYPARSQRRKAAAAEAKQFLVSPPLKFRLDRVPIDVFKTNCSENDAVRYFELDHLQRPGTNSRRRRVSYVPSESPSASI